TLLRDLRRVPRVADPPRDRRWAAPAIGEEWPGLLRAELRLGCRGAEIPRPPRTAARRRPRGVTRHVHQLLAALSYGDAIGNEALAIQKHLRAAGYASDIFAEKVHPRVAHLARPLWEYREVSSPETVCLFHFSIGSASGRLIYHAPDRLVSI